MQDTWLTSVIFGSLASQFYLWVFDVALPKQCKVWRKVVLSKEIHILHCAEIVCMHGVGKSVEDSVTSDEMDGIH